MYLDLGMDAPDAADNMLSDPIPLQNVNGAILKKVIEWCQQHKDDPPPTEDAMESNERRTDDIPSWVIINLKNGCISNILNLVDLYYILTFEVV